MEIKVSIIIVNYNSSEYTKDCLKSLFSYEKKNNYEVIIVDNNSREESKAILRNEEIFKDSRVKVIFSEENLGFGAGNNLGVENSRGEYVLLLNTDTLIENEILNFSIDKFEKEDNLGILGFQLIYFDESIQASYGYFPTMAQEIFELVPSRFKKKLETITKPLAANLDDSEIKREVDYVSGAFMFMKKSSYQLVNGFDERFFMYFEETDLCKRIKGKGLRNIIYNNKAVKHKGGGSVGAFSENKANMFIESKLKYLNLHGENSFLIKTFIKSNALVKEKLYKFKLKENKKDLLLSEKVIYWKTIRKKCK